jgi:integrase
LGLISASNNHPTILVSGFVAMRGSMRERRPATWELIASLGRDPLDGRYRKVSRTVKGTKREAQRALAELVTEVTAGRETGANATISDLLA